MSRATWDAMKMGRDGHLGFGPDSLREAVLRPIWDRITVLERDADGHAVRWLESIDGLGTVQFGGRINKPVWDQMIWRAHGLDVVPRATPSQAERPPCPKELPRHEG